MHKTCLVVQDQVFRLEIAVGDAPVVHVLERAQDRGGVELGVRLFEHPRSPQMGENLPAHQGL